MSPPGHDPAGPGEGGPGHAEEAGREQETLPPDARVNLAEEREATGINEVFDSLDADLVGQYVGHTAPKTKEVLIDFPDYTLDELDDIGRLLVRAEGYTLTPEAQQTFREYLEHRKAQPRFSNGRSVRNAIERARLRHASRMMATDQSVGRDELTTLKPEDFLGSRPAVTTTRAAPQRCRAPSHAAARRRIL